VRRLWSRKHDETNEHRFEIRVNLCYRIGALAHLIEIVTSRHAIITGFSTKGANHILGLGESYVDLSLSVRGVLHKHSLLAEIAAAGFSYEEKRFGHP
jgi:hypothetical protein